MAAAALSLARSVHCACRGLRQEQHALVAAMVRRSGDSQRRKSAARAAAATFSARSVHCARRGLRQNSTKCWSLWLGAADIAGADGRLAAMVAADTYLYRPVHCARRGLRREQHVRLVVMARRAAEIAGARGDAPIFALTQE
jgi:hypothetical protein